jgi:inorganic pyrophosphatase
MAKKPVNPTNYENIPPFDKDELVHAVIETPGGIRHKYAFEPKFGIMLLKQTLPEGLTWPYDYGFVPGTLADDGDPIDILVLNDEPTFSGCLIVVRILGIVHLAKNGEENDRIVAAPLRQKGVALRADSFDDMEDVPKCTLRGIERFLVDYSSEEGNEIEFRGSGSRKSALKAIEATQKKFEKHRAG